MKLLKGHKIYSILTGKCPVCHEENMYKTANPYKLGSVYEMHDKCSNCQTKYKIEPSFFYGAMYVSYALGVAFSVAAFIIAYYFFGANLLTSFVVIVATLIGLMPIIMRLSRNIWINFFFSYQQKTID